MKVTTGFVLACFLAFSAPLVRAGENESTNLALGARVRVAAPHLPPVEGRLVAVDAFTVTIDRGKGRLEVLPLRSTRVSVQGSPKGRLQRALISGLGAGVLTSLLVSSLDCMGSLGMNPCKPRSFSEASGVGLGVGAVFGVIGFSLGERSWSEVTPAALSALATRSGDAETAISGPPAPRVPVPSSSDMAGAASAVPAPDERMAAISVRVTELTGAVTEGRLLDVTSENLAVAQGDWRGVRSVSWIKRSSILRVERVEVHRSVLKRVVIGAVAGFGLDFIAAPNCGNGPGDCSRLQSAGWSSFGGVIVGAGLGALRKRVTLTPLDLAAVESEDEAPERHTTLSVAPTFGRGGSRGVRVGFSW